VKVGVVLPNWVGDVAMATPALRTLRKHLPEARIVGVARPFLGSLLEGTRWLDAMLPWEHHGRGWLGSTWRLIRQLRAERLDVLILLRSGLSAGILARLSRARYTIGYGRRGLQWLLTNPEPPLHHGRGTEPVSAVDDYLHLVGTLGLTPDSRQLELATTPANEAAADGVWKRLALPPPDRVLLLNTGGAYGQAKHWPAEYCVSLGLRAAEEFGLTTLVLCGPQERDAAAAIEHSANHLQVRSLAREDVSFGTTKAIVRRSRLLVTTDSGPRHIASALNTPTVVLFGPIDPRWSRNYQRESIELSVPLDCAPCGRRVCPLGHHRCMRDLTVDQVLRAVGRTLEGSGFGVQGSEDGRQAA
jgi:lipopolysaccharide heptosyltransferase II